MSDSKEHSSDKKEHFREVNLLGRSKGIHFLLKCIAPIARLMPKTVTRVRLRVKMPVWLKINHPTELYGWMMREYFRDMHDPGKRDTMARLTDKLAVRDFIRERIGEKYLTKLYGSWDRPEDVDFDSLPADCVVKTTNGCATNIILRKGKPRDKEAIRAKLRQWMSYPFGDIFGQPHYSYIKPRIMAEEFLVQDAGSDILPYDYKFYCVNGKPYAVLVCTGRSSKQHGTVNYVFTPDWTPIPDGAPIPPPAGTTFPKPENYDEMLRVASELCKDFKCVRVDLYSIGPRIVFGEMTFTPGTPEHLSERLRVEAVRDLI